MYVTIPGENSKFLVNVTANCDNYQIQLLFIKNDC